MKSAYPGIPRMHAEHPLVVEIGRDISYFPRMAVMRLSADDIVADEVSDIAAAPLQIGEMLALEGAQHDQVALHPQPVRLIERHSERCR